MVDALGGALPGELVILAQEGRQLERLEVMGEQKLGRTITLNSRLVKPAAIASTPNQGDGSPVISTRPPFRTLVGAWSFSRL